MKLYAQPALIWERQSYIMEYKIVIVNRGKFISVPCKAVEGNLNKTQGDYYKVLLYILSAETDDISTQEIIDQTGVTSDTADNAVLYWQNVGIISICGQKNSKRADSLIGLSPYSKPAMQESPAKYSSKEIAQIVNSNSSVKLLFDQLELTLGRELRFSERCGYINLYEYYGFEVQSIILLVEYCVSIEKSALRYVETVAKSLFDDGKTDYRDIEKEVRRMAKRHSFESRIKKLLGIGSNLSSKQSKTVQSWYEKKYDESLIEAAYDRTLDNTGKLSFPYMNKILENWENEGVKSVGDIERLDMPNKKSKTTRETSYDIEDYEKFSINFLSDNKE